MARASRPPIVAVMGHIDHGKSSLLDYIRKANVVSGEAGGITQHVSAYEAEHETSSGKRRITFLDTPGHEAFRALRARGAAAADVAILVVAADEGAKPQTLEALAAIKEAGIPYVVALTKIDKREADLDRAKTSLLENGIYLEGLGGDVSYSAVSSKSGGGIPELLDLVLLAADLSGISADPERPASGFVLESAQDPRRGISATLIVKGGTLKSGSFVSAGSAYTPVRFIENFAGERIESASPSEPVSITGWSEMPPAGALFSMHKNRKEAEASARAAVQSANLSGRSPGENVEDKTAFTLVVKADVSGSAEAIVHELEKLSHPRLVLRILDAAAGPITEKDVKAAAASGGMVIGFHVEVDHNARDAALRLSTPIETFDIIYNLKKRIEELIASRAPKITEEIEVGRARVLKMFNRSQGKQIVGAKVESGVIAVLALVKIVRREELVGHGKIVNIQQARTDVKEVREGGELGAQVEAKEDILGGDLLVAYHLVES